MTSYIADVTDSARDATAVSVAQVVATIRDVPYPFEAQSLTRCIRYPFPWGGGPLTAMTAEQRALVPTQPLWVAPLQYDDGTPGGVMVVPTEVDALAPSDPRLTVQQMALIARRVPLASLTAAQQTLVSAKLQQGELVAQAARKVIP